MAHGKESIAVNLKQKQAIEIVKELSMKSDVLIEPFRKGTWINLENKFIPNQKWAIEKLPHPQKNRKFTLK